MQKERQSCKTFSITNPCIVEIRYAQYAHTHPQMPTDRDSFKMGAQNQAMTDHKANLSREQLSRLKSNMISVKQSNTAYSYYKGRKNASNGGCTHRSK